MGSRVNKISSLSVSSNFITAFSEQKSYVLVVFWHLFGLILPLKFTLTPLSQTDWIINQIQSFIIKCMTGFATHSVFLKNSL